ncbi:hypothetical protein [Alteromonas sp. H39]|uniref:hypothetical protein n=1 Tax=Alteromonas sp. H39 TaxID=3389876 RepID=UPI0039E0EF82
MKAVIQGCGLLLFALLAVTPAAAEEPYFTVSNNRLAYVQNAQKEAVVRDKLLLLVVGANWCHDSRALGKYLQDDALQPVLSDYVLAKVDAAWLDNLTPVLAPYGHPAYFGTPSVMVIAPNSKQLLNRDSMQRWQSAHNESPEALASYLTGFSQGRSDGIDKNVQNTPLPLAAFEAEQAARLYAAYAVLGELLAQEKSGDSNVSTTLNAYWREVSEYRHQLQSDLSELHRRQSELEPDFPEYPPLSFM